MKKIIVSACRVFIVACSVVDSILHSYMSGLRTRAGLPWCIRRSHVYDDVIKMYRENSAQVLGTYPFRVQFDGEKAVDTGGVCRDMYSSFWESACLRHFDVHATEVTGSFSLMRFRGRTDVG